MDDISLSIERGEFVSLLGPSGSGKTTLLMMLAGFEQPTSGTIDVDGRRIDALPPYKRNMGVVFQSYALFPHMSVRDNVAFPLKMRGVSKAEITERVTRVLDMVKLTTMAERKPTQLSGGQQQRVALARALVFEPQVILMDEPLGALDKKLREQMQLDIRDLHRRLGLTIVFVTHDQDEALTMSDRIAVFNHGRIEQIDVPLKLYHEPATAFVAGFVGDNNVVDGVVSDEGFIAVPGLGLVAGAEPPRAAPGTAVKVAIRPESIRPSTRAHVNAAEFSLSGLVNYGDSVVLIGAAGPTPLKIRLPAREGARFSVGETFTVSWLAAQVHVIPT